MGLTIHYSLTTSLTEPLDIRALVEGLRQFARDLPFQEVGELLEFQGSAADFEQCGRDDEHRWFKIQAGHYLDRDDCHYSVRPVHSIGFSTLPGEGSESANFGLSRLPEFIQVPDASGRKKRLATGLTGWRWKSFCKTQYASAPRCGGVKNFLKCHVCVVKLLDFIQRTGLVTIEVTDESEYWDHRDLGKLACTVGEWNEFIAAFAGKIKDVAQAQGVTVESAIAEFADFEHLEAKGLERLRSLHRPQPGHD